jgi:DNA-binding HxlR family transcriptional regulator
MILKLDPVLPGADHSGCPVRGVLDCIGDRWSVLVLAALSGGTLRFTEVRRVIGTVSQRVLAQTLRKLERDGYVSRKVYPTIPPKVEYALTPLGRSLVTKVKMLVDWAKENGPRVMRAREDYEPPPSLAAL